MVLMLNRLLDETVSSKKGFGEIKIVTFARPPEPQRCSLTQPRVASQGRATFFFLASTFPLTIFSKVIGIDWKSQEISEVRRFLSGFAFLAPACPGD
jgi:hypothetical protein